MTVEALTENVTVRLINNQQATVKIKKFLTLRERQAIINSFFGDVKVGKGTKVDSIELEASKMFDLMSKIASTVWADKNYTIDEVDGESLSEVIIERFDSFLGSFGFRREASDSTGSEPVANK